MNRAGPTCIAALLRINGSSNSASVSIRQWVIRWWTMRLMQHLRSPPFAEEGCDHFLVHIILGLAGIFLLELGQEGGAFLLGHQRPECLLADEQERQCVLKIRDAKPMSSATSMMLQSNDL